MKTLTQNDFYCQPPFAAERTGNYEKQTAIVDKWEYTKEWKGGNGNINHQIYFREKDGLFFSEESLWRDDNVLSTYKLISPALAMYRLVCMFFEAPICADGYKMVWHYNLKHKSTGVTISFSEWKGAFGVWLEETSYKKLPHFLKEDLLEILGHLISDECAHPYDNLVAGSVA